MRTIAVAGVSVRYATTPRLCRGLLDGPSPGPGFGYHVSTDNDDVKSKVFVSCGQHSAEERQIARDVCEMLRRRGFDVYLAIEAQTILEINAGIIRELKNSDCYLFVNFCRARSAVDSAGHCSRTRSLRLHTRWVLKGSSLSIKQASCLKGCFGISESTPRRSAIMPTAVGWFSGPLTAQHGHPIILED